MHQYLYSYLAFGAGVQSTALYLLVKHEPELLIDKIGHLPNKAYFADTRAEPDGVYQLIDKLQNQIGLPVPLEIVGDRSLLEDELTESPRSFLPYHVKNPDGTKSILNRKCTRDYKIRPIHKAVRRDCGMTGRKLAPRAIACWLGISLDESHRVRDAQERGFDNVYPLIELGWDRTRCYEYLKSHGLEVTKSGCFFCPFRRDWIGLKRRDRQTFERAAEFDRQVRTFPKGKIRGEIFIHQSCQPLDDAVVNQGDLFDGYADFGDECQGHCGV